MANWEKIKTNVKTAANKAIKTTGEVVDTASMQLKLKSLESKRDKQYAELGKLTYRQIKTSESYAGEISKVIEKLDEIREEIRQQNQKIEDAKKAKAEAKAEAKAKKKEEIADED